MILFMDVKTTETQKQSTVPFDISIPKANLIWNMLRRFPDDLQITEDRIVRFIVFCELLEGQSHRIA